MLMFSDIFSSPSSFIPHSSTYTFLPTSEFNFFLMHKPVTDQFDCLSPHAEVSNAVHCDHQSSLTHMHDSGSSMATRYSRKYPQHTLQASEPFRVQLFLLSESSTQFWRFYLNLQFTVCFKWDTWLKFPIWLLEKLFCLLRA